MNTRMRNILNGAGSVFCLWPTTDYTRFIPPSPEEQISKAWSETGHELQKAMGGFENERKAEKNRNY